MNLPRKPDLKSDSLQELADHVEARELEKERKKAERQKKKKKKEKDKQQQIRERMVAPILLIISIIASAILWFLREI